jgi:broad specificity phosphatase PhoE
MRLYIIRHADPDYPNNTITAAGHLEARALAPRMEREGITRIFSSPLPRALHTAQYTADLLKLPVEVEPWTEELGQLRMSTGPSPGMMAWDLHGHLLRAKPTHAREVAWDAYPPLADPVIRAEVQRVGSDSDRFLAGLGYQREGGVYRVVRSNRERVAVFCHGGFGLTWLAHLLEISVMLMWSGFWLPPSSVTKVLFDERDSDTATPRCLCVGDTSHLHTEELPIQPHGIKSNFD